MAMWRGMQEITVRALGRQARHERVGHLHKQIQLMDPVVADSG